MSASEHARGRGEREQLPDLSEVTRRRRRKQSGERRQDGPPPRRQWFPAQPRRVLLGWEFAEQIPHPGPPPERSPEPPPRARLPQQPPPLPARPPPASSQVIAAIVVAGVAALCGFVAIAAGSAPGAVLLLALCAVAAASAYRLWQRDREAAQKGFPPPTEPLPTSTDERQRQREEREHELRKKAWREALRRFEEQPRWHPVESPLSLDRVDLVGGTPAGRGAITTTLVADLLAAGGQVTVLDLTESATAGDLLEIAQTGGLPARLRVLPRDLRDLEEAGQLAPGALVDVLANVVHFAEPDGDRTDWATDSEILRGVIGIVNTRLTVDRVLAGLRVLIEEEPLPGEGSRSPLSLDEYDALRRLYGETARGAGITRRAFALANQLRALAGAGSAVNGDHLEEPLTVLALDRRASELENAVMASFLVHACVRSLRDLGGVGRWSRTLLICGADRLDVRNLERIDELAARSGIGLVTQWSAIPEQAARRIGSGNAIVGFMRLGNVRDAETATEQIGHDHVFVLSELTENVSDTVTDTVGDSYTDTKGTSEATGQSTSHAETTSTGHSRTKEWHALFFGGTRTTSKGTARTATFGESFTRTVSESTAIGRSTSRALGSTSGSSRSMSRSRELLVEPHELQHLPQTALLALKGGQGPESREVRLTDVNPAIAALPDVAERPLPAGRAS